MLLGSILTQQYNQDPTQFLSQQERMPDKEYSDIMNMVGNVGQMEKNLDPGMGSMGRGMGRGIGGMKNSFSPQMSLDQAEDPVSFMDALHSIEKKNNHHKHHAIHYPTTRLAKAVHLIHSKMESRKRALHRKKYGTNYRTRRRPKKDRITMGMMNDLLGKSTPRRKLGMGNMSRNNRMGGIDPNSFQDISTVMNGGHLLQSNQMPLENTSDLMGSLDANASNLGQKGIKNLSQKMVEQFMPQIEKNVSKEMKHKFGPNYLMPHFTHQHMHHHRRHHHHHHHAPVHSKILNKKIFKLI